MSPHLGHVHLRVRDVDRAIEFYTGILGLVVTDRHANFAFLTFGDHHHDLALQGVGGYAHPGEVRSRIGLYHTAFEVESSTALREAFEWLRDRGVAVTPVDHRISKALYFDDPDGNGVEIYLDTRAETGRDEWDGENRQFDPTSTDDRGVSDGPRDD